MASHWSDKDANGKLLTDGRLCFVIESDKGMPPIYIYGKTSEEVLEKAARTVETAQTEIHRLRSRPATSPAPTPTGAPAAASTPAAGRPTADEIAIATADLSNPAKAAQAVKVLLRAGGVDVDRQQMSERLRAVAAIAQAWEDDHPDYPKDPRNDQILMKVAANDAGGIHRVTTEHIDAAYAYMQQNRMLFEPEETPSVETTVPPRGTVDSRTVRNASSYRRNSLSSLAAPTGNQESAKHKEWQKILVNGNTKQLRDAIENEPGFADWVDQQQRKSA